MTGDVPALLDRRPDPDDRLRLFCFHHAGAGASAFAGWAGALGPDIAVYPVQLPGREARVREPRHTTIAAAIAELDDQLDPWLDRPYAFYGHSMGALLGYGLALRRLAAGRSLPVALLAGAYPGPAGRAPLAQVPDWDDARLADLLIDIGGMSEVVRGYPEWAAAAIGLLRDDLRLVHSWRQPSGGRLPVPIHVFAGTADPLVSPADAETWATHTTAGSRVHLVPGGHFFVVRSRGYLLRLVSAALRESVAAGRPDVLATW